MGLLDSLRNRNLKNRFLNPVDEYWDRRFGVHTFGWHPGTGTPGWTDTYVPFIPSAYSDVFAWLRRAGVCPDDVFVDLGAGLGRTTFTASWLGARRAVGVELVESLAIGAEANRKRSALRDRDIAFVCANALEFSEPDMTVLYMYHPFGEAVLEQVLANIHATRVQTGTPKKLRIVYANPVHEDVLVRAGWLKKTAHMPAVRRLWSSAGRFDAALWESL